LTSIPGLRASNPSAVTDTFWPQILGELGVVGLVAYAVFIANMVWGSWNAAKGLGQPAQRAFAFGAFLVMVEAVIESVAAPMFAAPSATYLVLGAVAVALSLRRTTPPSVASAP
jgi:Na+-transporting NADH:ubiquinone oxidoreductase subunit NqrB